MGRYTKDRQIQSIESILEGMKGRLVSVEKARGRVSGGREGGRKEGRGKAEGRCVAHGGDARINVAVSGGVLSF